VERLSWTVPTFRGNKEDSKKEEMMVDKSKINLPPSIPGGEKLGWLRRRYGFRMSDVETIIDEYQRTH